MTKNSKPACTEVGGSDKTVCAAGDRAMQRVLHQPLDASMSEDQMTKALTEAFRAAGFEIVPGSVNISKRRQSD